MPVNVCWTLRISAVSSVLCWTTSGASAISATRYGSVRDPPVDPDALAALDQHPQRPVGDPDHPRDVADHPDRVEVLRRRRLDLGIAAGDHRDRAVAAQRRR